MDEQSKDDALNEHLYEVARKVDRVLNAEPVENHAAIIGLLQVTMQRRAHEANAELQRNQLKAQQEMSAQRRFGVQ